MLDQRIWVFVVLKDYEIALKVFACTRVFALICASIHGILLPVLHIVA